MYYYRVSHGLDQKANMQYNIIIVSRYCIIKYIYRVIRGSFALPEVPAPAILGEKLKTQIILSLSLRLLVLFS